MREAKITEDQLDEILRLKGQAVRRDVEAANHNTRGDWDRADEADTKLDNALEALFNE